MDDEEAGASPVGWRIEAFANNNRGAPSYLLNPRPGRLDHYPDPGGQSPADDDYETRYYFERQPTPSFEETLRSQARPPPIQRAEGSAGAGREHTAQSHHLPRVEHMASSAARRFSGDGLDYRRPAGSARSQEVAASVDLTGDGEMDEDVAEAIDLSQDDDNDDGNIIDLTGDESGNGASHDGQGQRVAWGATREGQIMWHAREARLARERQAERGSLQRDENRRRHAPRLPRGMDIIIDLDNGDEEWNVDVDVDIHAAAAPQHQPPQPQQPPRHHVPSSPEIEFISSRTLPSGPRRPHLPVPPTRNDAHPNADLHGNFDDDDDAAAANNSDEDIQFLRSAPLPEHEQRRRAANEQMDNVLDLFGTLNGRFTHLRAQVERFHEQVHRTRTRFGAGGQNAWEREPVPPSRSASRGRMGAGAPHIRVGVGAFMAPVMDFEMVGFEIGGGRAREHPPPPPTYNAPPKAPEGFTRSPEEEGGSLVCPNCEEELCVGGDDVKRQVWIVKGCGHVYCGECTANRSAKRSAKGKERPASTNPFKVCVVEGCDKNVSNKKSMIQVFL
ncbi:hypothetical protein G6011_09520 [Alternaria panax]|uniref:Uncharacterized protein n=1 Tax=Alternaria panax TaxID=48097 RepID=A0AAD4IBG9_9PLEO|nr:hypothetical protein G6011_09520 [Alternaria panax]